MRPIAGVVLDWIEAHPAASNVERDRAVAAVPAWQWRAMWPELASECPHRMAQDVERRPVNGLCVEIGAPSVRCARQSPDGRGLTWLLSGGSALAYGVCSAVRCPFAAHTGGRAQGGGVAEGHGRTE